MVTDAQARRPMPGPSIPSAAPAVNCASTAGSVEVLVYIPGPQVHEVSAWVLTVAPATVKYIVPLPQAVVTERKVTEVTVRPAGTVPRGGGGNVGAGRPLSLWA